MSTPGEHKGNGTLTETSLQREDTKAQINGILQHFDVLPSRFDRFIFKYIYVYLIGLFFPSELLLLFFFLGLSPQLQLQVGGILLGSGLNVLTVIALLSILWPFDVWRLSAPKTLRDLFEKKRIATPDGDTNTSYLCFLENYRDALGSPKRYFLSGFPMFVLSILSVYTLIQILSVEHQSSFVMLLGVGGFLLITLLYLAGLYCFGIVIWAVYISGWHVRKLARLFELRIQPFHPDKCGGLKSLGNFCFGLGSPLLIGSGLTIGFILLSFTQSGVNAVYLAAKVGFGLLLLLYDLPVIVLAFILPLRDIHTQMVSEGETDEDTYVAHIEALRQEIQALIETNQVEAAKAVQEKKSLVETLHMPYPAWPFSIRSKFFSTVLGVSGSLLLGLITAALEQYFLPTILALLFHKP